MTKSEASVNNALTMVLSYFHQPGWLVNPDKSGLCLSNKFSWDYMGRFAIFNPLGSQRKIAVYSVPIDKNSLGTGDSMYLTWTFYLHLYFS